MNFYQKSNFHFVISSTFTFNELCFTFRNLYLGTDTRFLNHQGKGVIIIQRPSLAAGRNTSVWFKLLVAISRTYRIAIDLNYIPLMPPYLPFLISRASAIVTVVRRLCIPPLIGGGRYVSSTSYTIKSHLSLPFLLSLHVLSYQSVTRDFKQ